MTFSLHQEEVVMSSHITHTQSSNIHSIMHKLDTCALIFSSCALFTVYLECIMSWHPTPLQVKTIRAQEGSLKKQSFKQKWHHETQSVTYAPGLSTLSYLLHIVMQPPTPLLCCLRPPNTIHPA